MLKVCNSIYAQVTHAEIAFIYKIFRFQIKIQEIIIPEKLGRKMHFRTTQSEKHFPPSPKNIFWKMFFGLGGPKMHFPPSGNNISGKTKQKVS